MDYNQVRDFISAIDSSGFLMCELNLDNCCIKLSKTPNGFAQPASVSPAMPMQAMPPQPGFVASPGGFAEASPKADEPPQAAQGNVVTSPIVGTFYPSPGPGKPAFKGVGDRVKAGDVLCIIEAMKVMNEIQSEFEGELVQCLAKEGEMVEYGAPLFRIVPL